MAFKQKLHKIKFSQDSKTLDELYKDKIMKFDNSQKEIDLLNKKIILMKKKISFLENQANQENKEDIKEQINFNKKKITKYENEKKKLEILFNQLEFFDKTKDILIQYFDNKNFNNYENMSSELITNIVTNNIKESNLSNKGIDDISDNDISNNDITNQNSKSNDIMNRFATLNKISLSKIKKKLPVKKRHNLPKIQNKTIFDFLYNKNDDIDNNKDNNKDNNDNKDNNKDDNKDNNKNNKDIKKVVHEKGTLRDQYLTLIDSSYACDKVKLSPIKMCLKCNEELTLIQSEGRLVCQLCGDTTYIVIESEIPSHKDSINEKRKYPYNPINHLIEKLNQYQAKQTTKIPLEIYTIINKELKKNMIEQSDVSPELIEKILKKYKKEAFYEHHYLIFSHITNTPPPTLSREEEDDIKIKFKMIDKPFKLYKPKDRDNNPNYSVVLNKLFLIKAELENNPQMEVNSRYFRLLKSRDKMKKFDALWKKICNYNNWPFHSSF
jgi:hypothetical protein